MSRGHRCRFRIVGSFIRAFSGKVDTGFAQKMRPLEKSASDDSPPTPPLHCAGESVKFPIVRDDIRAETPVFAG
jgi:hypothetical protein